ncbi:hypothetical protein CAPTEDRAFT_192283 [Capitella teleta]|uniref:Uncharacterized protein n=1 Tax=Capitella teleta TaxID=283909 RepID=R7UAT2_CAPTE|nr:hypothetical protein CAPTEDRAFT_192283 [Capitella teleta]|eukprot:ELU03094.1 hypothetical protein CAPTEDRAFT_192283 [Capitella teleta]
MGNGRKDRVTCLLNEDGVEVEKKEEMQEVVKNYWMKVLNSPGDARMGITKERKEMVEGNGNITGVEVDRAYKEIALGKAGDESGVFGEQSGWSTFSEREAKAKMGYVKKIYVGGSMVAEVGRGVLLEMGLKSDWWRAVNRIAMDYNLDGVYYMLKYRRLSAEGKRLARIPDEWVKEMAKEKVERKVKHRELEKWIGKLKGTEDKKICRREERSENGESPDIKGLKSFDLT